MIPIPGWMLAMFTTQQLAELAVRVLTKVVEVLMTRLDVELADNEPLPDVMRRYITAENTNNPLSEGKDKLKNSVQNFVLGSLKGAGAHLLEVGSDTAKAGGAALKAGIYALTTAVFMRESVSKA